MKKILLLVATVAAFLFSSCNSCNSNKQQPVGVAIETDSIYWVNDSTLADAQTFVFEGTSPMQNNAVADVILTVSTINLNSDGTYTITTDYIDEGLATQTDNGEAIFLVGTDNDSTATVIELMSANDYPAVSFMMLEDSSLVKVDGDGKPVSKHKDHRLRIRK
ncbi:MAG: copper resistance protein NlpE N-terminal domain-containing protein [Bacteroidaceae bacterium]|nr:copper resistance protein NlpE N-terminal domain-containing protein [Bacteroidaceae bacterium]